MTRFLVDEDFNNDIVRGVLRRVLDLDLVRVQDRFVSTTGRFLAGRRAPGLRAAGRRHVDADGEDLSRGGR
jgi:hypothetical protein